MSAILISKNDDKPMHSFIVFLICSVDWQADGYGKTHQYLCKYMGEMICVCV